MGSTEEPERKRRHLIHHHPSSPPHKKQSVMAEYDDKKVDPSMLQHQNQRLAQQLDVQRSEISALEDKFSTLKGKQASYDDTLMTVNRRWNQLVDDLELLAVRANATTTGMRVVELTTASKERSNTAVPPDETFLQRLLERGATESSNGKECSNGSALETGLASRKTSTVKTMKIVLEAIDVQHAKNDDLASTLRNSLPPDEAARLLEKTDDELHTEISRLRGVMDALHLKHKEISAEIESAHDLQAKDQAEIKCLAGDLEETVAELEMCRRKLAALRTQKETAVVAPSTTGATLGVKIEGSERVGGPEKISKENREFEAALEEAKTLASRRLNELQEALQIQLNLSQQLQEMQDALVDDQGILSSRSYLLLNEQIHHLKSEVERYRGLVDQLQCERDAMSRREKEVLLKAEAVEAAQRANAMAEARAADLEIKLQQCMADHDSLELRLDEANQASGRKETVAELKVMVSTLQKEMNMMQSQLSKYKEAACEVHELRTEINSLAGVLERKNMECKSLSDQYAAQVTALISLKDEVQNLRNNEQELILMLEMFERESTEKPRSMMDLQQAQARAMMQVERMKLELDEHSLELRVKAANEAEAACQQRLAAAKAEISEHCYRLDDSERIVMELKETLKSKNEEGDAYISEIETIGQAYEEMQTQNQRLLQQITERDDYTTHLVAESVKAKQLQASLQAEKQVLVSRMQHVHGAADLHKQRASRLEDQARSYLDQMGKVMDESRKHSSSLEVLKAKAFETEKDLLSTKAALEAAHKGIEDRGHKLAGAQAELDKERFEKRRVQEELEALSSKLTRLRSHQEGSPPIERLQDDIKHYKAMIKCSVCHDRSKEVVITKCYHLFCGPCIQRNLEIRHRKCPGCGVPFGQSDVRNVYI